MNIFEFVIDLDEIDKEFVNHILDILEAFKVYKLCIFVCNRYRLPQRLGRYLVSISHKYSYLSNENSSINSQFLLPGSVRNKILENAYIASLALHNVFENINPEYLAIRNETITTTTTNEKLEN